MVRLRLPLSIAVVIRFLMLLAIFVPSSPIKIWPSLVSFVSMPSSSTTRVNQARIIALRLNNDRLYTDTKFLVSRWLGIFFSPMWLPCGKYVAARNYLTPFFALLKGVVKWVAKDNGMLFNFQARSMQILPIHPCYRNRNEASFELIPSSFQFSETVSSDITLTSNVTFQYQNKYKVRKKSRVTNLGRVFKTWSWIL